MSGFNIVERRLANYIGRFPRLKSALKSAYQTGNFLLYGERGFTAWLSDGVTLLEVAPDGAAVADRFFGYFDKTPWPSRGDEILLHQLLADGKLSIRRVVDKEENEIGVSEAWSWQQGAMTQWVANGENYFVVFNIAEDGKHCSVWLDPDSGCQRRLDWPVQAVAPGGESFVSVNYRRLALLRPDYGYMVSATNFLPEMSDCDDGLWIVDSNSGKSRLIITLERLRAVEASKDIRDAKQHKVNHVLFSPSGNHFVFVYRWFGSAGKKSRLFLYTLDTDELRLLMDDGMVSHYCWRNDHELIVYGRRAPEGDHYYLLNVKSLSAEAIAPDVLDKYGDGHPSVSPCGRYLLTDTYPDRRRQQRLLVYNFSSGNVIELGRFLLPLKYNGMYRVDLHPRWSPDGSKICIDSGHEGHRGVYVLTVGEALAHA